MANNLSSNTQATLSKKIRARFRELTKRKNRKVLGRIDAPDTMPLKRVIAVLNAFHEARCEKVDFVGIERAPRAACTIEDLPR